MFYKKIGLSPKKKKGGLVNQGYELFFGQIISQLSLTIKKTN